MSHFATNSTPRLSARKVPVDAAPGTSEAVRSSSTHSYYTSNGTVTRANPASPTSPVGDVGHLAARTGGTDLQISAGARLPIDEDSVPLSYASPIPNNIHTSIRLRNGTSSHAAHDGSHGDRPGHGASMFTPWIGSTAGARAWSAADEVEAAIPTRGEIWIATRLRRYLVGISCVLYLVAAVLLIVVQTGSTNTSRTSTSIFLFRFDLSQLFDDSVIPGTNTTDPAWAHALSQSLGLRNYYQSGLWGYCEGDSLSAFSKCSRPQAFYWFNPVGIIFSELLNTSTVPLPIRVQTVLDIIRYLSQAMFGTYLVGTIVSGLLVLLSPLVLLSRWWSVPIGILAAATALCLFIGSSLATAVVLAYRLAGSAINQLNIYVDVGNTMLALVWTASVLAFVSLVLHAILGICGPSLRDLRTGRRALIRLPPLDMMELPCEERTDLENKPGAAAGIKERMQSKGGAVAAALKPWFSPLAMHPFVMRENAVPASPPPPAPHTNELPM
ncbi:uncharacterized protein SPSK_04221 [Sporothrix schenckii 1099-18]|uniref:Integral membrane protein n=1 Tax=Sporothrix schenckii 1099-18 TaxID=1397361 RepID=A0A0F2M395_SPOSC|nr:uncharacterized protein SPSK_04221 [Sporothrix schenckii 1099-18]KJR83235.1 hypothetical protein SPSK_04221 [Sporothrix schenckii 1099-18]